MFTYNPDNKVLQALSKYFDLVWLTILWLLSSLPLVTLGPSTTALMSVLLRLASDTAGSGITRSFFAAWQREWRQSLPAGLVLLALGALAVMDAKICLLSAPGGASGILLWSATLLLSLSVACAWVHLFPLLARFQVSARQILRNLVVLTLRHPLRTLALLGLWTAALLAVYFLGFMGPLISGPLLYAAAGLHNRTFSSYITPILRASQSAVFPGPCSSDPVGQPK